MPPNEKLILVIDDQESSSFILSRFLEAYKVECISADSIDSALEFMKEKKPHLIFLDILLGPDAADGITFLKKRMELPWLMKVPVLVLSGQGDLDTIYESLRYKADGYLIKPFTKKRLVEKLQEFSIIRGIS